MSTKKPRKSLDDALATEFVFGKGESEPQPIKEPEPEPQPEPIRLTTTSIPTPKKPSLMSQLEPTTPKEATIRLTVDLSESMHRKLSLLAAKTGRKKAEIVRFLLDEALKDVDQ